MSAHPMNRRHADSTRELAFKIARRFPNFVPSAKQVLAAFPGLDRATAYRYVADYRRAWVAEAAA